MVQLLKDVRAKIFHSIIFFRQIMRKKCKKLGVTVFVSEIKRVVNYTDFAKLSHIIEYCLQRFIV